MSTYVQAAILVLEAAGHPMTVAEITTEVLRRGLLPPGGKTPQQSMAARPYVAVRRNPQARLVRLYEQGVTRGRRGSVRWALRDWGEAVIGRNEVM